MCTQTDRRRPIEVMGEVGTRMNAATRVPARRNAFLRGGRHLPAACAEEDANPNRQHDERPHRQLGFVPVAAVDADRASDHQCCSESEQRDADPVSVHLLRNPNAAVPTYRAPELPLSGGAESAPFRHGASQGGERTPLIDGGVASAA